MTFTLRTAQCIPTLDHARPSRVVHTMRTRRFLLLWVVVTVGACATAQTKHIDVPELHVVARPAGPDALEVYDAEALFVRGLDLLDGGAWGDGVAYFERLIREFPTDSHVLLSQYNRGICYIHLDRGDEAVAAFDAYLAHLPADASAKDTLDGRFKRGQALAVAKRYADVVELFDTMLGDDLQAEDRIEALVDAGIGHYMLGLADLAADADPKLTHRYTAEHRFLTARRLYKEASERQRLDVAYFVAQAAFYLAEIGRLEFSDIKLRFPTATEIKLAEAEAAKSGAPQKTLESLLGEQLEEKCQRLLRAQYLYLRTIREEHAGWASAAGYNVGRMYEDLHDEMVSLPAPDDLSPEAQALYRRIVRKKVLVLLDKAQKTWTATADMVTRTGAESEWSQKTRASLERIRDKLTAEIAATDGVDGDGHDVAQAAHGADAS